MAATKKTATTTPAPKVRTKADVAADFRRDVNRAMTQKAAEVAGLVAKFQTAASSGAYEVLYQIRWRTEDLARADAAANEWSGFDAIGRFNTETHQSEVEVDDVTYLRRVAAAVAAKADSFLDGRRWVQQSTCQVTNVVEVAKVTAQAEVLTSLRHTLRYVLNAFEAAPAVVESTPVDGD